jgi:hypothetical protein
MKGLVFGLCVAELIGLRGNLQDAARFDRVVIRVGSRGWQQTPPALRTPSSMPPRAATLPAIHWRLRIFQVCALPHDECAAKPALRLRLIASRSWRHPCGDWGRAGGKGWSCTARVVEAE